jgi:hypothetical protein
MITPLGRWLKTVHPGRGGASWLARRSECAPATIKRALAGEPILTEPARLRISAATDGVVTPEMLKRGAQIKRKAGRARAARGEAA